MSGQKLPEVLKAYRIGDADGQYPIFDPTGSTIAPGRWNTAASPMIYAAEHYSTALLEKLVHGNGRLPPNQHFIEITLPNGVSYEFLDPAQLPGWDAALSVGSAGVAQVYGETWHREVRSLLLFVPSVVARVERNVLINPQHPEFRQIKHTLHQPILWDTRLFTAASPSSASAAEPPSSDLVVVSQGLGTRPRPTHRNKWVAQRIKRRPNK